MLTRDVDMVAQKPGARRYVPEHDLGDEQGEENRYMQQAQDPSYSPHHFGWPRFSSTSGTFWRTHSRTSSSDKTGLPSRQTWNSNRSTRSPSR